LSTKGSFWKFREHVFACPGANEDVLEAGAADWAKEVLVASSRARARAKEWLIMGFSSRVGMHDPGFEG
jgi:hypothetical protein